MYVSKTQNFLRYIFAQLSRILFFSYQPKKPRQVYATYIYYSTCTLRSSSIHLNESYFLMNDTLRVHVILRSMTHNDIYV